MTSKVLPLVASADTLEDLERRRLFSVAAQMKLLVDTPEQVALFALLELLCAFRSGTL